MWLRIIFFAAQPPLLGEEGNGPASNFVVQTYVTNHCDRPLHEEAFERLDDGPRRFLGQIVAGIERAAGHVVCGLAPD
jgi:hypothetical protein